MKLSKSPLAAVVTAAFSFAFGSVAEGQSSYVIGGPDNSISNASWGWDGGLLAGLREALADPDNFGPDGAVKTKIQATSLSEITPKNLSELDAFVSSYWSDFQVQNEEAILNFFLSGGDLILLQDGPHHDRIGSLLGLGVVESDGSPSHGIAPLFHGPFGTASDVQQAGATGCLGLENMLLLFGQVAAINESGQVTAAYWQRGEYSPSAGSLLIINDVDMVSTLADYHTMNDNARFALNGFGLLAARERIHVIGGASDSIVDGSWSWVGSQLQPFRQALLNPENFGKDGVVPQRVVIEEVDDLEFTWLCQLDTFVVPYWADSEMSDWMGGQLAAYLAYGGNLLLANDSPSYDKLGDMLGVSTIANSDGSPSNGTAPLFEGPFGSAINVEQSGTKGRLDAGSIQAVGGHPAAMNASGEVTAAYWGRHEHGGFSGSMIITADVNMIAGPQTTFDFANDNGVFALNAMAFLMQDRPYRVAGPDADLAPGSGLWNWEAGTLAELRGAMENQDFFGPAGTVRQRITTRKVTEVNRLYLSSYNAFVSPYWAGVDSTAEQVEAVVQFFLNGGDLLLLQDSSIHDEIGAALGIPTIGDSDGTPFNGAAPLFDGPFGTATDVLQAGATGQLSATDVTDHNGTIAGLSATGEVIAAYWRDGQYAPNAGTMLIVTDLNAITTSADFLTMDDNAVFTLNLVSAMADLECNGSVEYYGMGCPGTEGLTPTIRFKGCSSRGNPFSIDVAHGLGGALGFYLLGYSGRMSAFHKDCEILVQTPWILLPTSLDGPFGAAGAGSDSFAGSLPVGLGLAGIPFNIQGLFVDPGASRSVSTTEALEFVIGE